jgi:hypothetical protein
MSSLMKDQSMLDQEGMWQPIETAPKDKTPVLGYQATPGDHEGRMSACWWAWDLVWLGDGGLMPTHWMPLPAPPSGQPPSEDDLSRHSAAKTTRSVMAQPSYRELAAGWQSLYISQVTRNSSGCVM